MLPGGIPELQNIILPVDNCILDGEMVCFDKESNPPVPSFESLMTRFHAYKDEVIKRFQTMLPVHFSAFDVLFINNERIVNKNLAYRLKVLESLIKNDDFISLCPTYLDGEKLFERVVELGLEGIVSKNLNKPYYIDSRPADVFIKIKNYQYGIFQIGAIRKNKFGWLMLQDGKYKGILEFVPQNERNAFYQVSKQLIKKEDKNYLYLEPLITCEVKYQCLSKNGTLRSPSFEKFIL